MEQKDVNKARSCACGDTVGCRKLQDKLFDLKYVKLCGWIQVQTQYSLHGDKNKRNTKPAERNRRIVQHMWPKRVGERGGKHSIPEKRVFLAKHHFNHSILMKYDEFPHKITADEARTAGYSDAADKVKGEESYWFCPTVFKLDTLLQELSASSCSACSTKQLAALKKPGSIVDDSSKLSSLRKLLENVNSRNFKAAEKVAQEREKAVEQEKRNNERIKEECLASAGSDLKSLRNEYYRLYMANLELQRNYEKLVKESEERERAIPLSLDLELKVFNPGLSRAVILDAKWHDANKRMARHLMVVKIDETSETADKANVVPSKPII
jgi:hypothetical protein